MPRNSHGKALEGGEFEGRETQCPAPLRFLSQERKLGKESELSRTPRWACLIDAFLEKSLAKTCVRNMLSTYIGNRALSFRDERSPEGTKTHCKAAVSR